MKRIVRLLCLVLLTTSLKAQPFTSSNLPIVIITTDANTEILDEPKVQGTMKIIYRGVGQRNFVSDQSNTAFLNYNGRIGIETRGSSSTVLEKKQYSLETLLTNNVSNNDVSILNMPKEHDWVLNGLAFDDSMIRDYITYTMSRKIGEYAPRTEYCEVMINGVYQGLYIFQEKIKADDNRVDISKIEPGDNSLPDLSGGYIIKVDRADRGDIPAWKQSSYIGTDDVTFVHEFPKSSAVTSAQSQYIKSRFDALSATAHAGNISFSQGYPSVIDVPSFVDFMIINELSANVDAYQLSTFFHKDKNGKLRAGPVWDSNLTYGNDLLRWGLDRSKSNVWQFDNGDNIGAKFWKDLFDNTKYKCYMSKRWNELVQNGEPLNLNTLKTLIDKTVASVSEAKARDIIRWPPIPEDHPAGHPYNYDLEIANIKSFLETRITWIGNNLGSFAACNNVQTPPLVITKIMYHPGTSTEFPGSSDQEFIEIKNNGNEPVDLTGVYFRGTGFVYQFSAGSIFPPQGVLQLANHSETFVQQQGFSPYGQFTRNLNNEGQKLTLADGFGNVIDEVAYSNESPWPNADGNGSYIQLTSADLDNAVATNWVASSDPIFTNVTEVEENYAYGLQVYPNPVEDIVSIKTNTMMITVQLHDLQGRLLETFETSDYFITFNMKHYSSGLYLLHVTSGGKTVVRKIAKKW
jgi:hypothetical protein